MGQGMESAETYTDRPTEVSVIRFVSRNRTIEEIVTPKKELYVCKERGCGQIFTSLEAYKTHKALESLKIRFICKEPGCNEEVPDPGSMWRHYLEWHNSEANGFVCPFTGCDATHPSNASLSEHIESTHRRIPNIHIETDVCYERSNNVVEEDESTRISDDESGFNNVQSTINEVEDGEIVRNNNYSLKNETVTVKQPDHTNNEDKRIVNMQCDQFEDKYIVMEQSKLRAALSQTDYHKNNETITRITTNFPKHKDLVITKENFLVKYETCSHLSANDNTKIDNSTVENNSSVIVNNGNSLKIKLNQEHRIEMSNLESAFRSGLEQNNIQTPHHPIQEKNNCHDSEEYTPKKQRMSRCKQEPYRCEIDGCGKSYKYLSHYRHHQESHKILNNVVNSQSGKIAKAKLPKSLTISFYLCKMPGCGYELDNVKALHKHYQESHANQKLPETFKIEILSCEIAGCGEEFVSHTSLNKHLSEEHAEEFAKDANTTTKTADLSESAVYKNATSQQIHFKTDSNIKHQHCLNEYVDSNNKNNQSSSESSGD